MAKITLGALLLLSAAVSSPVAGQQDNENSRKSLSGISGVRVIVEEIRDEIERDGLFKKQIQTDVELRLRQAGIGILADAGDMPSTGGAYVYINVTAFRNQIGVYAFFVRVDLHQTVILTRRSAAVATGWATTWEASGYLGTSGQESFASAVRDQVRDQTDQFINAYLAANPKR